MTSQRRKKEALFRKFSQNLKHVAAGLNFRLDKQYKEDAYLCPLSFKVFDRRGLNEEYTDQLTLEDVPPKSLGGKGICLTSKINNSRAGHTFDNVLLKHLEDQNFLQGKGAKEGYVGERKCTLN